jgi:hypothetical protein
MECEKLEGIFKGILQDAPSQQIDFDEPANAFTLWTPFTNVMKHCGSRGTLESIQLLAAQHVNQRDLYIVREPFSNFGVTKFDRG